MKTQFASFRKFIRYVGVAGIITLLFGCGGGGGSSSPAGPVTSTNTFPVSTLNASHINNGYTQSGNISGTLSFNGTTYPITGNFSLTVAAATATTFEGQAALTNTGTVTGSEILNGVTVPLADTSQSYSTTNYAPLGYSSSSEYSVMQGTAIIPSTVKVGDTAVIGTYTRYSNSSKATVLGTAKMSYVVEADTASTAIFNIVENEYNTANSLTLTTQERWRIDTSGTGTFVSVISTGLVTSGAYTGGLLTLNFK